MYALKYALEINNDRYEWLYDKFIDSMDISKILEFLLISIQSLFVVVINKLFNIIKEIPIDKLQKIETEEVIIYNCILSHYLQLMGVFQSLKFKFVKRFEYYFGAIEISDCIMDVVYVYRSSNNIEKSVIFSTIFNQLKTLQYDITNEKLKSYLDNPTIHFSIKNKGDKKKVIIHSHDEFINIDGYYIEAINPYILSKRSLVKTGDQNYLTINQTIIFISQLPNNYSLRKIKNKEGGISDHISFSKCGGKHFKVYFNDTMSMFMVYYYHKCVLLK